MKIFALLITFLIVLIGCRLIITAFQTALSGKILIRRGLRQTEWYPAPSRRAAWKAAFRDGLMGLLLIVLGIMIVT